MKRDEFIKTAIRYLLAGLLAVLAFRTGSRALAASDCSSCAGKGICNGFPDCIVYKHEKNGRKQ